MGTTTDNQPGVGIPQFTSMKFNNVQISGQPLVNAGASAENMVNFFTHHVLVTVGPILTGGESFSVHFKHAS
jgi:hypothetical protein